MEKKVTITLKAEKATKNTVLFREELANEFALAKLGSIYVPKASLAELGFTGAENIKVEISLAK